MQERERLAAPYPARRITAENRDRYVIPRGADFLVDVVYSILSEDRSFTPA